MDFLYSPRDEWRVFQQLKVSFKKLFLAGYLLYSTAPCLNMSHHRQTPVPLLLPSPPGSHPSRSSPLGCHGTLCSVSSLRHTADSSLLFYVWESTGLHAALSVHPTLCVPHCAHRSVSPLRPCR